MKTGNILSLRHLASGGNYTRSYNYESANNILLSTEVGSTTYAISHNTVHEFITGMPHLDAIDYNFLDQLSHIERGTSNTYYLYDAQGQRTCKVTMKPGSIVEKRFYIGNYEVYREEIANEVELERTTLHVQDDANKIAMLEERTIGNDGSAEKLWRYIYGNNLGNVSLELNENGDLISYEEYHPFGTTAYQATNTDINAAAKRYRYNAKERDEESGFYYYGARYYIPWLCRFTSVDPKALKYHWQSSYVYADNNPVMFVDVNGEGTGEDGKKVIQVSEMQDYKNVTGYDGSILRIPESAEINEFSWKDTMNPDYKPSAIKSFSYSYIDEGYSKTRTFEARFEKGEFLGYFEKSENIRYESGGFFSNETEAYKYMWENAVKNDVEMTGLITAKGVYVSPNAFADSHTSVKGFKTNVREGGLYINDEKVIGQIHTHQHRSNIIEDGGFSNPDLWNSITLLGGAQIYMAWDETVRAVYWRKEAIGVTIWHEFNNKQIKTNELIYGNIKLIPMLIKLNMTND